MPYHPADTHHRRSIRLPGYDYAQAGAYFVTLCTQGRECLFGDVMDGVMQLNDAGLVAERCWLEIPTHFPRVVLDAVIIMPNHVHGILVITDSTVVGANNHSTVGAKDLSPLRPSARTPLPSGTSGTIGSVVRGFKIGVTKWMRHNTSHFDVWQRDYYEHIIHNEESLRRIREYIVNNPLQWMLDRENPDVAASTGRGEKYFAPTSIPTNAPAKDEP
ncbi:MAG: transposase [Chloroflexi bacterium]|nr:transposase [Chloroflexota bacterium]